jgi:hypothetical protein
VVLYGLQGDAVLSVIGLLQVAVMVGFSDNRGYGGGELVGIERTLSRTFRTAWSMTWIKYSLPNPSLITESAKMADMISRSPKGLCGGNDFRDQFLKGDRLSAGKAKGHQVEKSR